MDTMRPLPRRPLPPLDGATPSESAGLESTKVSEPRPKKRSPRRKQTRSPELLESEQPSQRSLPELEQGDTDQRAASANVSTTSKAARARRRQANRKASRSPRDQPQVISNGNAITNILSDEDIVPVDRLDDMVSMTNLPGIAKHNGNSQAQEKVYVQTNSGFTSHTKDWLQTRQLNAAKNAQEGGEQLAVTKSSDVALSFHRGFLFFTLLIHGILAGLAVWEVVVAFIINGQGNTEFMQLYQTIALPLQTAFYIAVVLCFVSAMDRFNFAKYGRNFFQSLAKVDGKAWMIVLYFISLMFNIGLTGLDDWLATANIPTNSTLTSTFLTANLDDSITKWHAINVIRALFALLGWALIAFHPETDNTSHGELFGDFETNNSR
uniref:Transmembrane protein 237 n=1 Tax=Phallusia mammillata TaxID=59560 RepID=A0A6F9DVC5_9ASCI|nr:transmembrane protein 237 [Phallusia mammillata]